MDLDSTDKALLRSMSRAPAGRTIANTAGNKLHAYGENN